MAHTPPSSGIAHPPSLSQCHHHPPIAHTPPFAAMAHTPPLSECRHHPPTARTPSVFAMPLRVTSLSLLCYGPYPFLPSHDPHPSPLTDPSLVCHGPYEVSLLQGRTVLVSRKGADSESSRGAGCDVCGQMMYHDCKDVPYEYEQYGDGHGVLAKGIECETV